ncbi:alpha/beta hydrolase [Cesiribacter andamanensis]|uniref:Putative esterase n=1 Tax=Cesiribacter andamanensis AMV16 TaxID=1279009 RepID=M7NPF0_9BACT|nr:alpha/beta fold hydrolase [Cesiribacter andamanensis]EMR03600.1 putative esterase [Cesiribacter andamanensis AMV16]
MQHTLTFSFQARYFSLGTPGQPAWLVCHGYGQLASYFIRHFQPLADAGYHIVAPEGLSRFYLQQSSGRVGASWMTREDRLSDIQNYLQYLDAVAAHSQLHLAPEITLLGFSQGVATISRWAMHTPLAFRKLVLWAGVFPPDLPMELSGASLKGVQLHQVWGLQDPYLDKEKLAEQTRYLQQLTGDTLQNHQFEGAHSLHTPTLLKVASL